MMHITSKASAYLENVWIWTADHDIDTAYQAQVNVFSARGLLVESQGPTWLWGTAVEHSVSYQYQFSSAKNVVAGLIQTESPYFQPFVDAPIPFLAGAFIDDPTFKDCPTCVPSAWAVRLVDSESIFILSTALYSWFNSYDQTCIDSGAKNCQTRLVETQESNDIWIYNLVTIGAVEMISPVNGNATIAAANRNGFASSILAWFGGSTETTGVRTFQGYQLYTADNFLYSKLPAACQNALQAAILCDDVTRPWTQASYHGSSGNATLMKSICDAGCARSLTQWVKGVVTVPNRASRCHLGVRRH